MSARAKVVLPAPRSPDSVTRSPGSSAAAMSMAKRTVACSFGNVTVKLVPPVALGNMAAPRYRCRGPRRPAGLTGCGMMIRSAVHRDDNAANPPKQAVFKTADLPQPLSPAVAPHRPGGHEQKHRLQQRHIARIDREHHADRTNNFDRHTCEHPGLDRIEP